jgi:hypothetical protein
MVTAHVTRDSDGKTVDVVKLLAEAFDLATGALKSTVVISSLSVDQINISDHHTNVEKKQINANGTSQPVTFSQDVKQVIVQNTDSTNTAYLSITGGTATVNDIAIFPRGAITRNIKVPSGQGISVITSGPTVDLRIEGAWTP